MIKHTQTIRRQQPTNRLSVFDHFWGLAIKELNLSLPYLLKLRLTNNNILANASLFLINQIVNTFEYLKEELRDFITQNIVKILIVDCDSKSLIKIFKVLEFSHNFCILY